MHLYHLTLQNATSITAIAYGSYSQAKSHEVVVARGSVLELIKASPSGALVTLLTLDTFGIIRALLPVRLMGQTTDYLAVTSDSGRLSILQYSPGGNEWVRLQLETFGKSGVRRTTPGQYLAKDPYGRALMVAAVEKQKFVYLLNRDGSNALTISPPLEAHRSRTTVFDAVGLDNGFDNPLFCCLEVEYPEEGGAGEEAAAAAVDAPPPPKHVVHYELDLGLNTVVKKWARETDPGASSLLAVPGGADGPGGVLVLCENWVMYESAAAPVALRTPLPRRSDFPDERGLFLGAATLHKSKTGFFALLQSELGDLYKVTLGVVRGVDPSGVGPGPCTVHELTVKYFDTIPPASAMSITRNGLLFAAGDGGSHALYQFSGLGEASDAVAEAKALNLEGMGGGEGETVEVVIPVFVPRALTNLVRLDESLGLHPLTEGRLVSEGGGRVSLLGLCGKGASSASLTLLRQGIPVTEAAVSPMQGTPTAVFTLKSPLAVASPDPGPDTRIVLSFTNATVVLSVGESVEEMAGESTGFDVTAPTLAATLLPDGSYIQVHPGQMRVIAHDDKGAKVSTKAWAPPKPKTIVCAATNSRQVVLGLSGGGLQTFEYEPSLRRPEDKEKTVLGGGVEVCALAVPPVAPGRQRAPFCVVADTGNMVRVLSLEKDKGLEQVSSQALRSTATSLAVIPTSSGPNTLHLFIGLANGVQVRLTLDGVTGVLSDPRPRFLGPRPVRLAPLAAGGGWGVLSLSTRTFLSHSALGGRGVTQPLTLPPGVDIEAAAPFSSDALPEAFLAVSGRTLRIFSLGEANLGAPLHASASLPLQYTPRRAHLHPASGLWAVVEAQHDALDEVGRSRVAAIAASSHPMETAAAQAAAIAASVTAAASGSSLVTPRLATSPPPPKEGGVGGDHWASALRLVDLASIKGGEGGGGSAATGSAASASASAETALRGSHAFSGDETVVSSAMVAFGEGGGEGPETFFVVGTAIGLQLHPRSAPGGCFLLTFRVAPALAPGSDGGMDVEGSSSSSSSSSGTGSGSSSSSSSSTSSSSGGWRFELVHRTSLPDIPSAMAPFHGRLLVGVGGNLVQYDLGKKQLLKKTEHRGLPSFVTALATSLDRVFVGHAAESVTVLAYLAMENRFAPLVEDTVDRYVTALTLLDYDTVVVGDRFGSVCVLRVPDSQGKEEGVIVGGVATNPATASSSAAPTASATSRLMWEAASAAGALRKFNTIARFFVGGAITSLFKGALQEGGPETLLYTTIAGGIGAFSPLTNKEDVDFFMHLEMYMRAVPTVSVIGRDHGAFRSYFSPVLQVIDGDLCEAFLVQPAAIQKQLAGDLTRPIYEVSKKMEEVRTRILN